MASSDEAGRSATPGSVEAAPAIRRSDVPRPPSLVSSRMTDIGSDDGGERDIRNQSAAERRTSGLATSEGISRPGTARTGLSSGARGYTPAQPLRRQLSGNRGSVAGSVASSAQGRPPSSTTRSHVPSLTSHAFFHPLSSQRLQAQRGAARSTNLTRPHEITSAPAQEPADDGARNTPTPPGTGAHIVRQREGDGDARAPPSRGTEVTEQEASDRITANTSPTRGHYPTGSLTESVRPLQKRQGEGLTVDTDKTYKSSPGVPTPVKTPRSFKSSFRLPNRKQSTDREMQGGEKLASNPTSPDFPLGQVQKPTQGFNDKKAVAKAGTARNYNYQYFEGNTVFCFGGRLQNTKHRPINIATGLLVVIPCVLFFVFSAPWIWFNISPAIPITFAYVFYICMSSFLHGSGSDPGILPRNMQQFPPSDENEDPLRLGPPTTDWTLIKSAESSTAAMEVPTKYCKTCNIWRPPRAHHCRLCDNCVETQDHHCVWLNNCVGRRNYRFFFTFVASATVLALYLLAASLAQILVYMNQQSVSFGGAIDHFRAPFAMVIYGFFGAMYPAALTAYHIGLMSRGETTREFLNSRKFPKTDRYRAFTQGSWLKNWVAVLCRPRPPTYYQFKGSYLEGDQRLRHPVTKAQGGKINSKVGMEMQNVRRPSGSRAGAFQGPVALQSANSNGEHASPERA